MNLDELKEYLGKIDYSSGRVACFGITPWDYWSRHKFDHNQRKIRKGYPYLSKRAHIYINKYIKENRIMYMDKYLYDIWAKDCYCKCQNAKEKKRIVRERKEADRERKLIKELTQKANTGKLKSENDIMRYAQLKNEGKMPKTEQDYLIYKIAIIVFLIFVAGIILWFGLGFRDNPIHLIPAIIFCVGTVVLGLTGHGR